MGRVLAAPAAGQGYSKSLLHIPVMEPRTPYARTPYARRKKKLTQIRRNRKYLLVTKTKSTEEL